MGWIVLYEGNGATQDIVDNLTDEWGQSVRPRQNDEARSALLVDVRPGTKITLFDNSKGDRRDDWAEITVKRREPRYVIPSFERDHNDDVITQTFVRRDNLDGKVSRVNIEQA